MLSEFVLDLRYVALKKRRRLKAKIDALRIFFYPCKIKRGLSEMSESLFRLWPVLNLRYTVDGVPLCGLGD